MRANKTLIRIQLLISMIVITCYGCKKESNGIVDGDGNVYTTVTIGTQIWLKENLMTTKYNDGTDIPHVTSDWSSLLTPAYCWFNNAEENRDYYGGLYNFFAVKTDKLCPEGYHVPSIDEWDELNQYLGTHAGGLLKSTALWSYPNEGATNLTGFSALPGGIITSGFAQMSTYGYFWSSTNESTNSGEYVSMTFDDDYLYFDFMWGAAGMSVRCIKD